VSELSPNLRQEVLGRAYASTFVSHNFFAVCFAAKGFQDRVCLAATNQVFVRGEVVQTYHKHPYHDEDSERCIRFLFKGTLYSEPDMAIILKPPRTLDEDLFFSTSGGNVRLPRPVLFAVEYTEVLSVNQEDLKAIFDIFPRYIEVFVRRTYQIRWSIFAKCLAVGTLVQDSVQYLYAAQEEDGDDGSLNLEEAMEAEVDPAVDGPAKRQVVSRMSPGALKNRIGSGGFSTPNRGQRPAPTLGRRLTGIHRMPGRATVGPKRASRENPPE
jgi:hypothetical protein